MNESLISKIKDETARKVIYHQHLQIEALKRKIDLMEQQKQPTQAIGFHHVKASTSSLDMSFPRKKFTGGD